MKLRFWVVQLVVLLAAAVVASGASALVAKNTGASAGLGKPDKDSNGSTAGTGGKRERTANSTFECPKANETDKPDTITFSGTDIAWPPNHKYRPMKITATDRDNDGTVMLNTSGGHDQMIGDGVEMGGAGNTDPATDVMPPMAGTSGPGSVFTTHEFRGERSGKDQSGRTYTWKADAIFDMGTADQRTCHMEFISLVPHDQGKGGPTGSRKAIRYGR